MLSVFIEGRADAEHEDDGILALDLDAYVGNEEAIEVLANNTF